MLVTVKMPGSPIVETLRGRIRSMEDTRRRASPTILIADAIDRWFPNGGLPAGSIHEVKGTSLATAIAFSAILSTRIAARIAADPGKIVYISSDRSLYPLGLLPYGIQPCHLLLVSVRRTQDLAWAIMEALRCPQVSAVITVFDGADLTTSRRLQLAAENSGATGFLLGNANSASIASPITRWKISSNVQKPTHRFDEPNWILDLLYCRGGRPGRWSIEWRNQKLIAAAPQQLENTQREALAG